MSAIPLFTQSELAAAFRQILPPGVAQDAAGRWWEQFAGAVDERGYYLYADPLTAAGIKPTTPQVVARVSPLHPAEQGRRENGLVSDELHERMRAAQGLTPEQADVQRTQMRRIVAAIQQFCP